MNCKGVIWKGMVRGVDWEMKREWLSIAVKGFGE